MMNGLRPDGSHQFQPSQPEGMLAAVAGAGGLTCTCQSVPYERCCPEDLGGQHPSWTKDGERPASRQSNVTEHMRLEVGRERASRCVRDVLFAPRSTDGTRMRYAALVILLLTAGVLLAGCGREDFFDLEAGTCFNYDYVIYSVGRDEIDPDTVEIADSAECAAVYRVYAHTEHPASPGAAYPGDWSLFKFAQKRCENAFGAWIERGGKPRGNRVSLHWIEPTTETWRKNDRLITCFFSSLLVVQ